MALRLRLSRMGSKHNPHYRVVAQESRFQRDGRFIEIIGHYDPAKYPESVTLAEDKVREFLKNGALPTQAVKKLLAVKGIK